MDAVYEIKQKLYELQSKLVDVIFFVSLFIRLIYTMINTPQSFSLRLLYLNLKKEIREKNLQQKTCRKRRKGQQYLSQKQITLFIRMYHNRSIFAKK